MASLRNRRIHLSTFRGEKTPSRDISTYITLSIYIIDIKTMHTSAVEAIHSVGTHADININIIINITIIIIIIIVIIIT